VTTAQDTVAAAVAYLDGLAKGLADTSNDAAARAAAAARTAADLRAIQWGTDPNPVPDPVPDPTPDPTPHPHGTAFSGMNPDNSDMAVDKVDAVGSWRGAPVRCYTVFNWGHKSWPAFMDSFTKGGWAPARIIPILAKKGVVPVCTIPGITVGSNWSDAVAGKYDSYHQACAKFIAAQNFRTTVVIRLSRESNDKNQPFYYGDAPAERALFKKGQARIMRIYRDAIGADKVKYSLCVMKRAHNWQDAYDKSEVDIMDIDAYMNTPVIKTGADYDKDWNQNVQPHIDQAVKDGKPVAFSEWAIKDVEMPLGIERRHQSFVALAKAGVLHHENYFNSTSSHAIFGATKFPDSAKAYVAAWSGKGG
jgi:hypothetical protein